MAYWVKGHPYKDTSKTSYKDNPVIHRFDALKEAEFFENQVAHGEILTWGDGKNIKKG